MDCSVINSDEEVPIKDNLLVVILGRLVSPTFSYVCKAVGKPIYSRISTKPLIMMHAGVIDENN